MTTITDPTPRCGKCTHYDGMWNDTTRPHCTAPVPMWARGDEFDPCDWVHPDDEASGCDAFVEK